MRYRYLDDFGRGISVFAIFSYGIAVLGTPQCPPLNRFIHLQSSVRFTLTGSEDETMFCMTLRIFSARLPVKVFKTVNGR